MAGLDGSIRRVIGSLGGRLSVSGIQVCSRYSKFGAHWQDLKFLGPRKTVRGTTGNKEETDGTSNLDQMLIMVP